MRSRSARDYFAIGHRTTMLTRTVEHERRRAGRIRPEMLDCNLGAVQDVSPGGIRIRTRRSLRGRRRVILRREGDEGLLLFGSVRWSRRVGFRRHEVGLTFARPSAEDAAILKDLALGS